MRRWSTPPDLPQPAGRGRFWVCRHHGRTTSTPVLRLFPVYARLLWNCIGPYAIPRLLLRYDVHGAGDFTPVAVSGATRCPDVWISPRHHVHPIIIVCTCMSLSRFGHRRVSFPFFCLVAAPHLWRQSAFNPAIGKAPPSDRRHRKTFRFDMAWTLDACPPCPRVYCVCVCVPVFVIRYSSD